MKAYNFTKIRCLCKNLLHVCLGLLVLAGCSAPSQKETLSPDNTPSPSPSTAAVSSVPVEEPSAETFKLYEGTYTDAYYFGDAAPTLGLDQYYTLTITGVTDTTFDFRIHAVPVIRDASDWYYGEPALLCEGGTAQFTDGETNAQFQETDGTLYFTFPNSDPSGHDTAPDVAEIRISGIEEISDIHFVHLDIPGYELEAKGTGQSEGCARYLPEGGSYTQEPDGNSASLQIETLSGDSFVFTVYDSNGQLRFDEQIAVFEDLNSPVAVYRGEDETICFDCNINGLVSLSGLDREAFPNPRFANDKLPSHTPVSLP